jgi:hypothetical protein
MDPSDMGRRIVEYPYNLRVVWRGSQLVNLVYVYVYVGMWLKCGGIVGAGGKIKQFLF